MQYKISDFTTKELVAELQRRDGVKIKIAEPYQQIEIGNVIGPAIILVVTD